MRFSGIPGASPYFATTSEQSSTVKNWVKTVSRSYEDQTHNEEKFLCRTFNQKVLKSQCGKVILWRIIIIGRFLFFITRLQQIISTHRREDKVATADLVYQLHNQKRNIEVQSKNKRPLTVEIRFTVVPIILGEAPKFLEHFGIKRDCIWRTWPRAGMGGWSWGRVKERAERFVKLRCTVVVAAIHALREMMPIT